MYRGSSPLTRGKRHHAHPSGASDAAHPRSRGENMALQAALNNRGGSSPLTRGKPRGHALLRGAQGLIPAHAGKTADHRSMPVKASAHPRSRGENGKPSGVDLSAAGSSPLTRGKHRPSSSRPATPGLIPAHAGKTAPDGCSHPPSPAHPRSRGENEIEALLDPEQQGSSPLTRGKRDARLLQALRARLIPAHAGKTLPASQWARRARAHPRSRGENWPVNTLTI